MNELSINEIFIRLILSIIFSGLIGFEREKSHRSAGLKTHILVGMGAATISLIQINTIAFVSVFAPDSNVKIDAVRLIAQVVSGIGFLGAGTIIVTKRSVTGLTTAASIWCVSAVGLAFGMGYYEIGILSGFLILIVLILFKRILVIPGTQKFVIKFLSSKENMEEIERVVGAIDPKFDIVGMSTSTEDGKLYTTQVYRINTNKHISFSDLACKLSSLKNIINIKFDEFE